MRVWRGALVAVVSLAGCGPGATASNQVKPVELPLAASAEKGPTAAPSAVAEPWTVRLEGVDIKALSPRPDGSLLVVGRFDSTLSINGFPPRKPSGDADIVSVVVSRAGKPVSVETFGSDGDDDVRHIDGDLLSIRVWGSFRLGDDLLSLPPQLGDGLLPCVGAVVRLDDHGRPGALVHSEDDAFDMAAWETERGTVVAAYFDNGESPSKSGLTRLEEGRPVWRIELPEAQVTEVLLRDDSFWVASRGDLLDMHKISVDEGRKMLFLRVRPGFDDLGSIVRLFDTLFSVVVIGYTSGPVQAGMSHAGQPFIVEVIPTSPPVADPVLATGTEQPADDPTVRIARPLIDAGGYVLDAHQEGTVLIAAYGPDPLYGGKGFDHPGTFLISPDDEVELVASQKAFLGRVTADAVYVAHKCGGDENADCVTHSPRQN